MAALKGMERPKVTGASTVPQTEPTAAPVMEPSAAPDVPATVVPVRTERVMISLLLHDLFAVAAFSAKFLHWRIAAATRSCSWASISLVTTSATWVLSATLSCGFWLDCSDICVSMILASTVETRCFRSWAASCHPTAASSAAGWLVVLLELLVLLLELTVQCATASSARLSASMSFASAVACSSASCRVASLICATMLSTVFRRAANEALKASVDSEAEGDNTCSPITSGFLWRDVRCSRAERNISDIDPPLRSRGAASAVNA
mmetsp:Transcript_19990/g.35483  ORF Transcript_19990/g.35483 Transcript_19990/m.35483 type:complete len:264 (-) Transcript_19990:581-1372(-)